jgi:hypothetical protein
LRVPVSNWQHQSMAPSTDAWRTSSRFASGHLH